MATARSYSRLRRRPLVRLAGTLHAPRSLAHACGLTSVRREPATSKFRRRRRVMVPLLVESYSGDLSAPLMLTLLPWDFLRPTRAYRYAGTCRARAGLPHGRGRHTTLILWMLEQLELPTHLLHFVVRHTQHGPQTCTQSHGQLNESFSGMCGDPMRVPASTCQLVRQTNIMMEYRQLDWAAGIRARPSAVCLTLLTPRAAALRPKACGESCTTMPREPGRTPALNVYGVQQSDAMMEYRQLDWAAGSCVLLRPRCHGRPRCPARDYALRSRARAARAHARPAS